MQSLKSILKNFKSVLKQTSVISVLSILWSIAQQNWFKILMSHCVCFSFPRITTIEIKRNPKYKTYTEDIHYV